MDYRVRDIHTAKMRVTELVPGRRVVWLVLENYLNFVEDQSEWVGTEIRFELVEQDGGTRIDFTHDGLLPEFECYEVCDPAWTFYLRTSLPQLLTTGTGLPEQDPGLVEPVVTVAGRRRRSSRSSPPGSVRGGGDRGRDLLDQVVRNPFAVEQFHGVLRRAIRRDPSPSSGRQPRYRIQPEVLLPAGEVQPDGRPSEHQCWALP